MEHSETHDNANHHWNLFALLEKKFKKNQQKMDMQDSSMRIKSYLKKSIQ